MDISTLVGQRIRSVRGFRCLDQKMLADKIGVSAQTVSNWENGRRTPDARAIRQICIVLDCSADYLFGLTDEINKKSAP